MKMARVAKEKTKQKNTKDNSILDLDNEIIIGIKTLPEPVVSKSKKKKSKKVDKKTKKNVSKNVSKNKKNKKEFNKNFEFKLTLDDNYKQPKKSIQKKKKISEKKDEKMTKQQKIARQKKKIIFKLVKWTSILAILICGGIYFILSSYFNIKQINTIGNKKITTEELINLSKIQLEENIFKIRINQIKKNVNQNAYIDTIKINRKLPDTIEIEIVERIPTYMISFANAYVYINNQGYFLEVCKEKIDVPIITGFSTLEEDIHEGNRLCIEDLQKLDQVLQIMKVAGSNNIANLVTRVNISDKQDYVLELKSEKKTIHVGDTSNLSTKMLYVKSVLEQNKNIEGEIFVNTDLSNEGAIFRKKI